MQQVKVMLHFRAGKRYLSFQTMDSVQLITAALTEVCEAYTERNILQGYSLLIEEQGENK